MQASSWSGDVSCVRPHADRWTTVLSDSTCLSKYAGLQYLPPFLRVLQFHHYTEINYPTWNLVNGVSFSMPIKISKNGFSLIEMLAVIVILGILASYALPRYSNLGKDSRVAALHNLAGALMSAANIGYSECLLQSTVCNIKISACSGTYPYFMSGSKKIYTHYGRPTGWGACWVDDSIGSIVDLTDIPGNFTWSTQPGNFNGIFQLSGSPDPLNCKVIYQLNSTQATLTTTIVSTGC